MSATYDVFLSHSGEDKQAIEMIARRLRQEAGLNPFLDKWHLTPGKPWQREIEDALERSACTAVFFGLGREGPWRNEELQMALTLAVRTRDDYRVIPVLLPGGNPEQVQGFLQLRTWVDFRPGLDTAEPFHRLVAGIRGQPLASESYSLPDNPAPYRGLLRFEREHAGFFFGRESEIGRTIEKLTRSRFLAIVGASGSGKSSLARAGLLSRLEQDAIPGSRAWHTLIVLPGSSPLRALADQLSTLAPIEHRQQKADELAGRLLERVDGLRTAASNLLAGRSETLLLLVDQFEELFTHGREATAERRRAAARFIDNICDAATAGDGAVRVVITLRADFVAPCLEVPRLRGLLEEGQVLLGNLDEPALREAILLPAQRVGAFLEQGLINLILRDVSSQPAVLPLLEHALFELWLARKGPWLTLEAYERNQGVAGALHRRAQQAYGALRSDQQAIARNIFLRLTTLDAGAPRTRRRAQRSELYPADSDRETVDTVIAALSGAQARLIVADQDTIEIAHEALLEHWGTLRQWIEESRDALWVHRRLTNQAIEWDRLSRNAAQVYDAARLIEVKRKWAALRDSVSAVEKDFVRASWDEHARAGRGRVFWGLVLLAAGLTINALLAGMVFSEGAGVAAMNLVPLPLGFGLGGVLAQRLTRRPKVEFLLAVLGGLVLEGILIFFFLAIWPSL
jgi:hypothetical protein